MSAHVPVSVPYDPVKSMLRWATYVLVGGAAGLVVGVGTLFVVAMLYGQAIGLAPANCLILSCVVTLLLSQPAGVAGMVAGGAAGAAAGGVMHYLRHSTTR